ncbi:hypothetical protein [Desertivirga xinjiangensis]|uniref:hypothetical protein n=1 Tax=Desertivirga xinjiangensis TaxID=539206 RepID=UPI00210AB361|nr:hypothetical protein [Pedobacter xinjiangensis]
MTGKQIFEKHIGEQGEYGRTLFFMVRNVGDDLFPLLEKAEAEGKKLEIKPLKGDLLTDEITIDDIILV